MLGFYLYFAIVLNFLTEFLLLLGTNRFCGFPAATFRCLLAAALGGGYALACLLFGRGYLASPVARGISLLMVAATAFGGKSGAIRCTGVFLFLSLGLGILTEAVRRSHGAGFVLCILAVWLLYQGAGQAAAGRYLPVEICFRGKRVDFLALRDTGNTLTDPVTGEPVLILASHAAQTLTGLTPAQLANPTDTLLCRPLPGLRLIPYHTVAGSGMMLAMRFARVRIGKRERSTLIAFAPYSFGEESVYQALTGGML